MAQPSYGLIGRGRVATHMAHYLRLEEQPCTVWHRGLNRSPEHTLERCTTILLAISDDSLTPFAASQPWLLNRNVVHFSGSRVMQSISGLHPAMTFGPDLFDLQDYREIPFVEQSGGVTFSDIFPGLQNPSWALAPELTPLYHALCVLGGNGIAGLTSIVLDRFEDQLGLPREVLRPLLEKSLANSLANGFQSMTGPWIRGDQETVESNLAALRSQSLDGIYQACHGAVRNNGEQR